MSAEFAPGTVAVATVRGVEGVRVMRVDSKLSSAVWASAQGPGPRLHEGLVTDVRPLVVLDLDLAAHIGVGALVADLRTSGFYDIADQIEAQTKPPKPAEPTGLGAVVQDDEGQQWVQVSLKYGHGVDSWKRGDKPNGKWTRYDEITAVRVLSEGVTA